MTYRELITEYIYPGMQLLWKLFKGVAPTAVALLAIYVNNSRAEKRDRKNRRKTLEYNVKKEFLELLMELSRMQWNCGEVVISFLSETNDGKREKLSTKLMETLNIFLTKAQEINDYYNTMIKSGKIELECENIVAISKEYTDEINNLLEKYMDVYKTPCIKAQNQYLDKAAQEMLSLTAKVKEQTNPILQSVSDSIFTNHQ